MKLWLGIVLGAMAVGCGTTPEKASEPPAQATAPEPVIPAGFKRFVSERGGFSIALPKGMESIDPQTEESKTIVEAGIKANSEVGSQIDTLRGSRGLLFMAMDFDQVQKKAKFVDQVIVGALQAAEAFEADQTTLDSLTATVVNQVPSAKLIKSEIVPLSSGKALRIELSIPVKGAPGNVVAHEDQYFVRVENTLYNLVFSSLEGKRADDFRKSVETIRPFRAGQ